MKLTIIDTNFTANNKWMFKLKDEEGSSFYIMNASFYREMNIRSPITRNQLHYYFKGSVLEAEVKEVDSIKIVTAVFEYALT